MCPLRFAGEFENGFKVSEMPLLRKLFVVEGEKVLDLEVLKPRNCNIIFLL